MEYRLDPGELSLRERLRGFADEFALADLEAFEAEIASREIYRQVPTRFWPRLAEFGVVGMGWSEPWGQPASQAARFVAHEELDLAGLPKYRLEQSEAVGWMLATSGRADLAVEHLPRILDQSWNYAGGHGEPEAVSDARRSWPES